MAVDVESRRWRIDAVTALFAAIAAGGSAVAAYQSNQLSNTMVQLSSIADRRARIQQSGLEADVLDFALAGSVDPRRNRWQSVGRDTYLDGVNAHAERLAPHSKAIAAAWPDLRTAMSNSFKHLNDKEDSIQSDYYEHTLMPAKARLLDALRAYELRGE